ncbi:MAG: bifunctional diaminohydroxyphosphoribosylaminopyrimidine deaminase/5-amino-6-(5-phosphoribosylamino)uracil reductase RibD [Thermoanaerobaculia bacterium]|nr:bifunctional diaminohydroxyphosphoribosylaminopyrimidine deaminase/5-amino-6-(5-phosphoribosylamino)uracil reductase RibD [Thermoanaerobaculia bacterium]MCZ7650979.1 bifunctional diaminohydroxyphosphoribosylaminopyrimidine deaminase/5-amino-6-(5-phosphoribosylamino)uracil reductase RibD [Thermoanaerobaculia bacterium]
MRRALALAARGRYRTSPNPMVGAVVLRDGRRVGEGYHRRVGGPHAEVEALAAAGAAARAATLFVTLEPCDHHGRTPPCTEAILAAGVVRVVAAHRDPDPRVRGAGLARLRAAGVEVEEGPLAAEAVRLNLRYLVPKLLGRPLVTLKWAASLDGKIATAGGESQWISGPAARRWALALRDEHDAVLVGIGTALADDPRLDRRLGLAGGPGTRVVLDRRLRLPPTARLFDGPGPVLLYTEAAEGPAWEALAGRGAAVVRLERVEPAAVLGDLARRGVGSVLVEGGGEILAAFAAAGLFERVTGALAPLLIGGRAALGPLGGNGIGRLAEAPRVESLRWRRRGADLVFEGVREGCLPALCASVGAS